ncbi:hypothetical protein BDP55DRAFT_626844 [Colletotrichum godetiae]|uniref:Uncharacterized protein n=1 Tax=Colletotrichum godetiae TaxID=1209918 RepID=A0AAJ0AVI7_9PEZI|nr:uncharacterized protein BDP55DRAFT_626844 [Colletotrichum godetiae]KAK1691158.1 hypothetical protein BDP55DRAFT_626844 [Colletotrichum godetiae]
MEEGWLDPNQEATHESPFSCSGKSMEKDSWHRAGGAWGPPKFVETLGNTRGRPSKGVQCHTTNETKASEQVKQNPKESSREIVGNKQLALLAGVLTVWAVGTVSAILDSSVRLLGIDSASLRSQESRTLSPNSKLLRNSPRRLCCNEKEARASNGTDSLAMRVEQLS